MAIDLDDGKTGGRGDRTPGVRDLVDVFKFPEKKWTTIRLDKGLFSTAGYWITTKKKDGSNGKFPTPCPSYDPEAQERDSTKADPWRDCAAMLYANLSEKERKERDKQLIQFTQEWWMIGIVRAKQKQLPERMPKPTKAERASGFKDKDSDSLTAKYAIKLGRSLLGKIQELKGLNTVESKQTGAVKAFAVNDVKYGRDLRVYYDSSKAPADQYQVQLGEKRTPLTEEEQAMLSWDLATATAQPEIDEKLLAEDFKKWADKMGIKSTKKSKKDVDEDEDFDDEEDEDEDEPKSKKSKGKKSKKDVDEDDAPKKGKKSKKVVDEDEDDEEDDADDEEEAPKSKKAKAGKKSKKSKNDEGDEDDEDDDFDDEEDEDEDEPKSKKSKGKKAAPAKSKKDDDDFDDEEDEDEDEPKSKKSKGKKVVDEDDFDDEDDEDEDDEEDEEDDKPVTKKGKKSKSKKGVDEDDFDDEEDNEDDEDDEDDEEDDEPKSKKSKGKKSKAGKKSKKVDDDDEDEDDIPF